MHSLRSLLVAFMVLWLPLHGVAAVAMPFCQHAAHETGAQPDTAQHHAAQPADHRHSAAHQQAADQNGLLSNLDCGDCGPCHLACSPLAACGAPTVAVPGAEIFSLLVPCSPSLFVPEQPKRPPLPVIA
jgi:hypothetical protein